MPDETRLRNLETICEELMARVQVLEDRTFTDVVTKELTSTTSIPVKPALEHVPVPGELVGSYSNGQEAKNA